MYYKIAMAQIDPNGLCNSGCWFCPVAYSPNPIEARKNMPIEQLENILQQLVAGKNDFVSKDFNFIYTAHYNEVLLYKYFEEMLQLFRKYGFKTIILTNGTPLTKLKTDIIKKYLDVVYGICFNIPSGEAKRWSELVGMPETMFEKLKNNVEYAMEQLPQMVNDKTMSIQINGVNQMSLTEYGGWITMLPNAPKIDLDINNGSLATELKDLSNLFPGLQMYPMPNLIDRAGHLDKSNVITNIDGINQHLKKNRKRVIGCGNGKEVGGRTHGWIHINANGDLFICCNDYDFETVFGNINDDTIKNIWEGSERQKVIANAFDTICRTCAAAIWV